MRTPLSIVNEALTHPIYNKNMHPNIGETFKLIIESKSSTEEKVDQLYTVLNLTWLDASLVVK